MLDAYLAARPARPNTVIAYRRAIGPRLADGSRRPFTEITRDMVRDLHRLAPESAFAFPLPTSASGHIEEPKKATAAVTRCSGVQASAHDLRRSFALAAGMAGVGSHALKGLLNHSGAGDVTAVNYLPLHVERLREPMEKVAAFILRAAGVLPGAGVVSIARSAGTAG